MNTNNKTEVVKDLKEKTILVRREFDAPVADVWRAFTESELLDQWWGPSPWHAETKHIDFREGGHWLYAMVGPANEKHWARMNYLSIQHQKNYRMEDLFCDENGKTNSDMPVGKGQNTFTETANGTRVEFKLQYPTEADIKKLVDTGFEEGIKICFDQLEQLFKQQKV